MGIETESKTPAEKTLTMRLEDGKELFFPDQKWYPVTKTIADALHKQRRDVGTRLHQIISKNPGINFMTVRQLEMSGRLMELESKERSQTIICDQENFQRIILAYPLTKEAEPSRKASSRPRKPQLPSNFNPLSQLDGKKRPLTPASKDRPSIRMPYQILAVNSVKDILSHLLDGTLSQVPHDLRKYLEKIVQKHIVKSAFSPEELLRHILSDNSPIRLKRFFRVSLDAMLYDLWDVIDINERTLREEKEIIGICRELNRKGYDKKRVIQELFTHFCIPIPNNLLNPA